MSRMPPPRPCPADSPLFAQPRGATFEPSIDGKRLEGQARRVWDCMSRGHWLTLSDIAFGTGDPEASVSARLRDFRRIEGVTVHRRRRGPGRGQWEYRVEVADA